MQPHNSAARTAPVQVIAVSGGKGGVGKTTVSVNLAAAMAAAGRRVLLLDGDLGLANVDVLLGLTPRYTLQQVVSGERRLEEVLVDARPNLRVAPAASGVSRMANLDAASHAAIVHAFATLPERFDTLIVDTAAGIGDSVQRFTAAAQHVLVVLRDEPASLTDAYALIKVLSRDNGVRRFRVLVNMMREGASGELLFRRLQRVTDRYLDVQLEYAGDLPEDRQLLKAVRAQRTVIEAFPNSVDALVRQHADLVRRIAYHLAGRLPPQVEVDDLMQAGMIGLLEAAQHFTTGRGASFETYAGIRIRGAMLDALRKLDWAPRSVHRKARAAATAMREVELARSGEASDTEVAARMGVSLDEYHRIMLDAVGCQLLRLNDGEDGEDGTLERLADDGLDPLGEALDDSQRSAVVAEIERLPEREKLVLSLYYEQELTLKEIGAVLHVTESRVCQLHGQALVRLRSRLSEWQA